MVDALYYLNKKLQSCPRGGKFECVTGAGIHSEDGIPRIKNAVIDWLNRKLDHKGERIKCVKYEEKNKGSFLLTKN